MTGHAERRVLPYGADEMFALVADVDSYSEFLPWCTASRVTRRYPAVEGGDSIIEADLVVSFSLFREKFSSRVRLEAEAKRIDVEYLDGPFRHLDNHWQFRDLGGGYCEVDFRVDFELQNAMLDRLVGAVFQKAMEKIVGAFEARASSVHGRSNDGRC